jgi:hypothetical protein
MPVYKLEPGLSRVVLVIAAFVALALALAICG